MYSGFSCNAFKNWAPLHAIGLCAYMGIHALIFVDFESDALHTLHINSCTGCVSFLSQVFVLKSADTTKIEKS